ncbi:Uncharacterised protein [Actinobacillus equuli]|nr:Uncharacterised protein [Actinobacillus equuli]
MKYNAIQESKIKAKGYDELLVTARVFGDLWDQEGSWNVKFDIGTKQTAIKYKLPKSW